MKALVAAILLATVVSATDSDGGHAPPERWTHPRGPASGSGRSSAQPPLTFGGIGWTVKAKGTILAPPVTWDGIGFVIDGNAKAATLLAIDLATGKVAARKSLKAPGGRPQPAVHDYSIFLLEGGRRLVQYRYRDGKLARRWSFDGGVGASPARILDGEIYLPTKTGLLRLRAGSKKPVWKAPGSYVGEPAVYRGHVYALIEADGKLSLVAHNRSDGGIAASCIVGQSGKGSLRVAVGSEIIAVKLPEKRKWAVVSFDAKKPGIELARVETFARQPIAGRSLLTMDTDKRWCLFRTKGKRKKQPFVDAKARPDLLAGTPSPIVCGNSLICFGTWLGRMETNRVLWHLSERKDVTEFARGLYWSAVPAGHERLLVVPQGGKSVHLIGKEEIG